MRTISSINLTLTTWCSMACPDCCCDIPNKPRSEKNHVSWEYLETAAVHLRGIERINLTGGEPSLHPQFQDFVPRLKDLFGCRLLTIETNGYGFKRFPETYRSFDSIYCSHYTDKSFDGCPDNTDKIAFIKDYFSGAGPEFIVGEIDFVPRSRRGTKPCHRAFGTAVAYANGRLYPCCVGPGLPVPHGIALTANWRSEILAASMPCNGCFFAD